MNKNMLIREFRKNALEKVRVEFSQYKGSDVIDIKVHLATDMNSEECRRTLKGITMRTDLIPELKETIDEAYRRWKEHLNNLN